MRSRRLAWICWVLLLPVVSGSQGGTSSDLAPLLRRIQSFYRESKGLVSGFTQILESRTLATPQEESGTLYLKAPGKMRWEYSRPRGKLAVCDGSRVFLYLPEDKEVLVGSVADLDSAALTTRLLQGATSLSSEFKVEGEPVPGREGIWLLRLTPIRAGFPYDSLTLEVAAPTGAIQRISMIDALGNRMEYRFDDVRADPRLPEKLFTYRIPKGVEIQTLGGGRGTASPSP